MVSFGFCSCGALLVLDHALCLCVLQGLVPEQQYLLHEGQQLDASKTLADYIIQHQDTLELLLRIRCVRASNVQQGVD
jgi:hypothetical protein